ncbi:hypothetical protein FRC09_004271, partial [Ceratobasidium sp. 395]
MLLQPPLPPATSATPSGYARPSVPTPAPPQAANAASIGIASLKVDLDDAAVQIEIVGQNAKELQVRGAETQVRLRNLEKILMGLIGVKALNSLFAETPKYALAPVSRASGHPAPIPEPSVHSVADSIIPKAGPLDGESGKTMDAKMKI